VPGTSPTRSAVSRCLGGSERAPGIQRRRNGLIVRPNVDDRWLSHKGGFCKARLSARLVFAGSLESLSTCRNNVGRHALSRIAKWLTAGFDRAGPLNTGVPERSDCVEEESSAGARSRRSKFQEKGGAASGGPKGHGGLQHGSSRSAGKNRALEGSSIGQGCRRDDAGSGDTRRFRRQTLRQPRSRYRLLGRYCARHELGYLHHRPRSYRRRWLRDRSRSRLQQGSAAMFAVLGCRTHASGCADLAHDVS
jgi:hypothetical protein